MGGVAVPDGVRVRDRLYGGGYARLGRLPFVDVEARLVESREGAQRPAADTCRLLDPGPLLRALAVDRRLVEAVSHALDIRVVPTYRAAYAVYGELAHVEAHVDDADYELTVHVTLAHDVPDGARPASLVLLRPEAPPERVEVAPGEAIVLRGRRTVHARERLRAGERREALAIGFRPEASSA